MGTMKYTIVGTALLLAGLLSGCGGSALSTPATASPATSKPPSTAYEAPTTTKAPTPAKTPVGPPANGGSYATALELKAAVETAGLPCTGWVVQKLTYASGGNCGGGMDILAVYADQASLDEQLAAWNSLGRMAEMKVLVGKNWTVNSASATALQKKLGGKLFTTPGK